MSFWVRGTEGVLGGGATWMGGVAGLLSSRAAKLERLKTGPLSCIGSGSGCCGRKGMPEPIFRLRIPESSRVLIRLGSTAMLSAGPGAGFMGAGAINPG